MANSATMCQLYVGEAIAPLREKFPTLRCIHYMDDILLTAKNERMLDQAYVELIKLLERRGLHVAPEKVQKDKIVNYLGVRVCEKQIIPQKI